MQDRSSAAGGPRPSPKLFYGWWIVAAGSVISALQDGTYFFGFSMYFLPVTRDFGLSRAATSLVYGLGHLEGGVVGPAAGYLVDRLGSRTMIAVGGVVAGLGFILLATAHSFATFLFVYVGILSLGIHSGFSHGVMAAVNQWFIRRKALAMSITSMGFSVGGVVITPGIAFLVLTLGWRSAAVISGIVLMAVVVPLSLVMRRSPESMGLLPDGDRDLAIARKNLLGIESSGFARQITTVDFTTREAIRTPTYWLLAVAIGLRISGFSGLFVHLVPLIVWKGQTEATGAFIVVAISFVSIPVRVFLGWIGDRWATQKILGITNFLGVASLAILLLSGGQLWQLLIFATLFAAPLSGGGLCWALIGDLFGRKSFATLRGGTMAVSSFMSMGVPVFAGWVYDASGSYYSALIPMIGMYLMAALLFWQLPRPRPPAR
ncbi:MAG: MFS transporter [Dehalococcoidia bacterium]|nr:MFS transporter [Dehalococcoidia bacterium]